MRIFILIIFFLISMVMVDESQCAQVNEKKVTKETNEILKYPKSLFLLKKARIGAAVGEPNFYSFDTQLRIIGNEKKLSNP